MARTRKGMLERERFSEGTCPICGKIFGIPDSSLWAYKTQKGKPGVQKWNYFCSWKCFRIHEKKYEDYMKKNDGRKKRWKKTKESDPIHAL